MPMPLSGAARPSRSESNMLPASPPAFSPWMTLPTELDRLDQAPEGAEQAEEHQQAGHVARDVARLVEPGGDRIEDAAHQLRRHRHAADAAAEDRRHRRQQHRRPLDREAGIGEAEIVDPGDFRIQPDHLAERQHDADEQHADDQRVEARIGHERHLDLLVQHEGDQPAEHDEHQHPQQEDAGRGQFERIEFFCHELAMLTPARIAAAIWHRRVTRKKQLCRNRQHKAAD